MRQKQTTIKLIEKRMDCARRVLCAEHPEREALFTERRIFLLMYVAFKRIAKLTGTSQEDVARTIGVPNERIAVLKSALKDPTFLSPEELKWYNNFLMTGETMTTIK